MGEWLTQKISYFGKDNPKWRGGKKEFICTYCNKVVQKYQCEVKGKRFFCSKPCFDRYRVKPKYKTPASEMNHEKHPRWAGLKFCKTCRVELRERKQRRRGYCSDYCCNTRTNTRKSGKEHHGWIQEVQRFCKNCGREIVRTHGRTKAVCCDVWCAAEWKSKNLSGRNSPLYKNGDARTPYPPEWNVALRKKIRERDSYRCKACGFSRGRLHVHHIDLNKQNCSESNLVTLCISCHMILHNKIKFGK